MSYDATYGACYWPFFLSTFHRCSFWDSSKYPKRTEKYSVDWTLRRKGRRAHVCIGTKVNNHRLFIHYVLSQTASVSYGFMVFLFARLSFGLSICLASSHCCVAITVAVAAAALAAVACLPACQKAIQAHTL